MKKITMKDILHNEKYIRYKFLFELIYNSARIPFKDLRLILCRNNGLKMNYPNEEKKLKGYDIEFVPTKKRITIPDLDIKDMVNDKFKFPNAPRLCEALKKLIELNLIEKTSDKKGKKIYTVTEYGNCVWLRDFIHMTIDEYVPDDIEQLERLNYWLWESFKLKKK